MGSIKDRNGKELTDVEDIKKTWQKYTGERYKKGPNDPDNHDAVITHLEPDILECEVKWALGIITTNKASEGDGIPVEPFQILKDDAVKVLHSICQQIWKTRQWPQDWKRSVFIPIPKKGNVKECSNYCTIALISHASKVMLKILKQGFNSTWTVNFQMFKLDLEKAEQPETKLPTSVGSDKNQGNSNKASTLLHWYAKPFDYADHHKQWEIFKKMQIPDHLTCLLRNLYTGQEATARTRHGTTDWFITGKGIWWGCGLLQWLSSKESAYNVEATGDMGLITGSGRSSGGGHSNPLQYSCLESPMDRGAWRATLKVSQRVGLKWLSTARQGCILSPGFI